MITYSNIQRHDNLPFEEYLKLGGYSHSFLKRERMGMVEDLKMTDNIMIGKLVDAILTEPKNAEMSNELYPVAKLIAYEIQKTFGGLIVRFQKQVSFTADVTYRAFTMPTTGRLDYLLPGHAVIDLKVTKSKHAAVPGLVDYMGYKNQLWHYAKMAKVNKSYLMIHSIPSKSTILYAYDCSLDMNDFWAEKIITFGKVA